MVLILGGFDCTPRRKEKAMKLYHPFVRLFSLETKCFFNTRFLRFNPLLQTSTSSGNIGTVTNVELLDALKGILLCFLIRIHVNWIFMFVNNWLRLKNRAGIVLRIIFMLLRIIFIVLRMARMVLRIVFILLRNIFIMLRMARMVLRIVFILLRNIFMVLCMAYRWIYHGFNFVFCWHKSLRWRKFAAEPLSVGNLCRYYLGTSGLYAFPTPHTCASKGCLLV